MKLFPTDSLTPAAQRSRTNFYKTDRIDNFHPEYYLIKLKGFPGVVKDSHDEWMLFLK